MLSSPQQPVSQMPQLAIHDQPLLNLGHGQITANTVTDNAVLNTLDGSGGGIHWPTPITAARRTRPSLSPAQTRQILCQH